MHAHARYLKTLGLAFAGFVAITTASTALVDPYYTFGTPLIAGLNRFKPAAYNRSEVAKSFLLERSHPRTLLLGNSRVEVGLNPESAAWPVAMQPVFDAGVSGSTLDTSVKFLDSALRNSTLHTVLVGVDVLDFLRAEETADSSPGTSGDRLPAGATKLFARLNDYFESTVTLGAVVDSATTILMQHRIGPTTMTPLGFNPLEDYQVYVKQHGFRDLFDQKQAQYAARFPHYVRAEFAQPYRYGSFRAMRQIIQTAQRHHLQLTIVVYPYHAWVLQLLSENDLWTSFEDWKRALVRVVDDLDPNHRQVRIVDFSGYHQYATILPPATGDTNTDLRWYWEPGHFRPALGDKIIARVYGGSEEEFGRDLTSGTLDAVNAAIRREAWMFKQSPAR